MRMSQLKSVSKDLLKLKLDFVGLRKVVRNVPNDVYVQEYDGIPNNQLETVPIQWACIFSDFWKKINR